MLPSQRPALADHQHTRALPGSVGTLALDDGSVTTDKIADEAVATGKLDDGSVTLAKLAAAVQDALSPTGAIVAYGGTSAPSGWLLCDGTAVSRSTYAALFAVVGTAFGAGDGSQTFGLPDLRGRFPLGKAAAGTGSTLGGTGGTIDHVHGLDTASSGARIGFSVGAPGTSPNQRKTIASYNRTQQATFNAANNTDASTIGVALTGDSASANPAFQSVNYLVRT